MNILIRRRVATGQDLAGRIPRGLQGSRSSLRTRVSGDYHAGHIFTPAGGRLLAYILQLSQLCAAFERQRFGIRQQFFKKAELQDRN